jgi:hypothetical protein
MIPIENALTVPPPILALKTTSSIPLALLSRTDVSKPARLLWVIIRLLPTSAPGNAMLKEVLGCGNWCLTKCLAELRDAGLLHSQRRIGKPCVLKAIWPAQPPSL